MNADKKVGNDMAAFEVIWRCWYQAELIPLKNRRALFEFGRGKRYRDAVSRLTDLAGLERAAKSPIEHVYAPKLAAGIATDVDQVSHLPR